MSSDPIIQHETTASGGRYLLQLDGVAQPAVLDYDRVDSQRIIALHTGVPEAMRGQGAGLRLVERLVADAREQGWRIEPRCSYVRAQAKRHPEWADLFE